MEKSIMKWYERKRLFCGLPWTFTKYAMSHDRLFVETGLFSIREYEVRLYRITNINIKKTLIQRLFGLGTIHIDSNDQDLRCFELINITNSDSVKEMISAAVEEERIRNRVTSREFMNGGFDSEDDFEDEHDEF